MTDADLPLIDIDEPTDNTALMVKPTTEVAVPEISIAYEDGRWTMYVGPYGFDERGLFVQPDEPDLVNLLLAAKIMVDTQDATLWALGDLMLSGEATYGELMAQAEGKDGAKMAYSTLRKIKWTCKMFPREDRVFRLGIWYYAEVASVKDRKLRLELLAKAEDEEWSQRRLREESEKAREVPPIQRAVTVYPYDWAGTAKSIARKAPDAPTLRRIAAELEEYADQIDQGLVFQDEED